MLGRAGRRFGAGLAALALAAVAAGCGEGGKPAPFAYDRSAPLAFRDRGAVNHGYPIVVHDVSYTSPKGGRVTAYLVVPPGQGPFPAVIYAHGSGGSRRDLVLPAAWLAARDVVGLTVDDPFARDPALENAPVARQQDALVQEVVDLRRAVDLLQSLPYVDGKRIAFVGFSLGARIGSVLSGSEPRIEAFDLISGRGAPLGRPALDELRAIRHAHAHFLFQLGLQDTVVPRDQLVALAAAAPEPKTIRWYDAGHSLNRAALRYQLLWLSHELGVGGPVVRGAVAGP